MVVHATAFVIWILENNKFFSNLPECLFVTNGCWKTHLKQMLTGPPPPHHHCCLSQDWLLSFITVACPFWTQKCSHDTCPLFILKDKLECPFHRNIILHLLHGVERFIPGEVVELFLHSEKAVVLIQLFLSSVQQALNLSVDPSV